jgi:sodium/bile acid cotransporter 7
MKLNMLIQVAIFGLWPLIIGLPLKSVLSFALPNLIPSALVDGILIMTCLPTTVNMCIMLTSASGGNVAASICNAVLSNMAGIFVTPALLFQFFGTQIRLPFLQMVLKLCKKVLLPVGMFRYRCALHVCCEILKKC